MRIIKPRCGVLLRNGKICQRREDHSGHHQARTLAEGREYQENKYNGVYTCFQSAKTRAARQGVPFSLALEKMPPIPETCPVLGIPLFRSTGTGSPGDNSPSLDRIFPERGYVLGNVRWISMRANQIKNNATSDELWLVMQDSLRLGI